MRHLCAFPKGHDIDQMAHGERGDVLARLWREMQDSSLPASHVVGGKGTPLFLPLLVVFPTPLLLHRQPSEHGAAPSMFHTSAAVPGNRSMGKPGRLCAAKRGRRDWSGEETRRTVTHQNHGDDSALDLQG